MLIHYSYFILDIIDVEMQSLDARISSEILHFCAVIENALSF